MKEIPYSGEFINLFLPITFLSFFICVLIIRKIQDTCEKYWKLMLFIYFLSFLEYLAFDWYYDIYESETFRLLDVLLFTPAIFATFLYFLSYMNPAKITPRFLWSNSIPYILLLISVYAIEQFYDKSHKITSVKDFFLHIEEPCTIISGVAFLYMVFYNTYVLCTTLMTYLSFRKWHDVGKTGYLLLGIILFFVLMVSNIFLISYLDAGIFNLLCGIVAILFLSVIFFLGYDNKYHAVAEDIDKADFKEAEILYSIDKNNVLKEKLLLYFNEKKPYLDKDLKLQDLAYALNTNRSYISQLLNKEFNDSFYTFINRYRVEYSSTLMKEKLGMTVEYYAEASGFKCRSVFFKEFKKHIGYTPYTYINRISFSLKIN